jgi:hypothetical protein
MVSYETVKIEKISCHVCGKIVDVKLSELESVTCADCCRAQQIPCDIETSYINQAVFKACGFNFCPWCGRELNPSNKCEVQIGLV